MRQVRMILSLAAIGVIAVGWYLFRPELLFVNKTINEALPGAAIVATAAPTAQVGQARVLSTGRFHTVSHESRGVATVHQLVDSKRLVRLTEFATSNGPDVRVYLVAANDANDNDTVTRAGFIDLGALKGNKGDQNYEVPAEADLDKYGAVTIWCHRFSANFATAPLTPQNQI
jgi:hypothetical protein